MIRLYFVTLHNTAGQMVSGGHYLADSASDARNIGMASMLACAPDRFKTATLTAKARTSNAKPADFALNLVRA